MSLREQLFAPPLLAITLNLSFGRMLRTIELHLYIKKAKQVILLGTQYFVVVVEFPPVSDSPHSL